MKYIADTLGIKVNAEPWSGITHMPFYLADLYTYQTVTLDSVKCLFVKPIGEIESIPTLKKHYATIVSLQWDIAYEERSDAPVVIQLGTLNRRQRNALIAARIPFVVEGNQLYLPFIGAVLQERYIASQIKREILSPSAQLVLFRYLYQRERAVYTSGLAELFGLSAMQITRAVKQLNGLGLFTTYKDGTQVVIEGTDSGAGLFAKAIPHLTNPVRKRFYVEKDILPQNLPLAGISALSEYTMINPPSVISYAFNGTVNNLPGIDTLIDAETQAEVEVWRYSPTLISAKAGLPDPLSLWVTLTGDDVRIDIAKDELLAEIWKDE
jgi:DNA-binding MarR family transcriptional regulator